MVYVLATVLLVHVHVHRPAVCISIMEHNKHMHLLCIYNGDICHLVIFLMDKRQNKGHTIPGECQGVLLTMSFTPLTTRAFWAEMANFAGWAIFVSAYVFHSSLGYGPDAGLWDSEPLQCVNKVRL